MPITIRTPQGHVRLDIRRLTVDTRLALDGIASEVDLQGTVDAKAEAMALSLIARVPGKVFDTKAVGYPATWWDHFKADCLPTFCRWVGHEPKMETTVLEASAYYPTIQVPNHKPFVQVTLRKGQQ